MKIKTINPVIVNGKHESEPSKYLSANGMGEFETTLKDVSSQTFDNYYGANAKGEFETTLDDVASQKFNDYYGADGGDEYFNADGDNDDFYGFDASGKPTQAKEWQIFQDWMDVKYPGWVPKKDYPTGKLNKGKGYGTFGPATQKAWASYGTEWVGVMKNLGLAIANPMGVGSDAPTGEGTPTVQEQVEQAKKGKVWDKARRLGYARVKVDPSPSAQI